MAAKIHMMRTSRHLELSFKDNRFKSQENADIIRRKVLPELRSYDKLFNSLGGFDCKNNIQDLMQKRKHIQTLPFTSVSPSQMRQIQLIKQYISIFDDQNGDQPVDKTFKQESIQYMKFLQGIFQPLKQFHDQPKIQDRIKRGLFISKQTNTEESTFIQSPMNPKKRQIIEILKEFKHSRHLLTPKDHETKRLLELHQYLDRKRRERDETEEKKRIMMERQKEKKLQKRQLTFFNSTTTEIEMNATQDTNQNIIIQNPPVPKLRYLSQRLCTQQKESSRLPSDSRSYRDESFNQLVEMYKDAQKIDQNYTKIEKNMYNEFKQFYSVPDQDPILTQAQVQQSFNDYEKEMLKVNPLKQSGQPKRKYNRSKNYWGKLNQNFPLQDINNKFFQ